MTEAVHVSSTTDPAVALAACGAFLGSDPVARNVALTILHERVVTPVEGRYWWVTEGDAVRAYAWRSPPTFFAGVVPMSRDDVTLLTDAVSRDVPALTGVVGDAATAASFAGRWTELAGGSAAPVEGQRIYQLDQVAPMPSCPGALRQASADDVARVVAWTIAFDQETGLDGAPANLENTVRRVAEGRFWFWEDGGRVAMVMATPPVGDVTRVGLVYTPPERRRRGYATAMVAQVSLEALTRSSRCVLYTQLSNPSSNAIYRRIGYRAVGEVLAYRFGS